MKKFLSILLVLAMVFSFAACAKKEAAPVAAPAEAPASTPAAEPAKKEKTVFIQGFDLDYPPYSYRDDSGKVGGFDVEVAQAVCEYLGWEYQACPFNWDAKDAELESKSCDCIWSGLTYEGREDAYLWSDAYSVNKQMILVADDSGIKTLADLNGKDVGVQIATSALDLLEGDQKALQDTFASLKTYETYTIAFNDLKAGAIDAIAIDITAGSFLIADEKGYSFLEEVLGQETYAIGFRKDDTALRDSVNDAIKALSQNGTIAKIAENYPDIKDYLIV